VVTLVMGILGSFRPLVFSLSYLLSPTVVQGRRL
jgi:hypothetical protein